MAYSVFVYFMPLFTIIWAYSHIVKASIRVRARNFDAYTITWLTVMVKGRDSRVRANSPLTRNP